MTDNSKSPLYSLVTFGRNDNYNPDFLYRLQTMLNFNARALEKIGRLGDVEFVVVDWGSAAPLREALALEAPAAAATSFLELSPETAARVSDTADGRNHPRAVNVGIRRAQGQFVGIQGADLLTTSASWRALLVALEDLHDDYPALSKAILQIPRRSVPWSFVARQPGLDRWERWLLTSSQATPNSPRSTFPAVGGGMGVIVLHRDLWHEAKGLEEIFAGWGYSDIDLVLRLSAHHPWIDAGTYGVACHKMEHAPHGLRGRLFKQSGNAITVNSQWITTSVASRFADWGLPHLALDLKKAKVAPTVSARDDWSEGLPASAEVFFDSDVTRHVRAALGRARYDQANLETLHMLSWFGLRKYPVNYLEIGLREHFYVRAISTACLSADIYVLESEEKNRDGTMHKAVDVCANLLWKWGHKGYFRACAGDLLANFKHLELSFIGPFDFETIMLRLEKPGDSDLLLPAFHAIASGGMLAIHAAQAELLHAALEACSLQASDTNAIRGHSGRTAFLFVDRKKMRGPEPRKFAGVRPSVLRIPTRVKLRLRAKGLGRRLRRNFSRLIGPATS
jgi:hypothetical protein